MQDNNTSATPSPLPDDPTQLRERVQKSIVDIITKELEAGMMTEDRAKEIAKYVLDMLPEGISYEKLIELIPKLDDNFAELSAAVLPVMVEYERKMKSVLNGQITSLLKEGKLDDALQIANQAIEQEKKLS
jgi:hypothetical protein